MTRIRREVTLACPPRTVYEILRRVERLPEFSPMTVAVRNGPGRPIEVGDTFEQVIRVMGVELETDWTVRELVPDALIQVEGQSSGGGRAVLEHRIVPAGAGCTVVFDVGYDPPLGVLGELADKALFERRNERDAEEILERLKELCGGAAAT